MRIILLFLLLSFKADALTKLTYSDRLTDHAHTDAFKLPEDRYLVLALPYEPAEALRLDLEKELKQTLKNRGESHITVLREFELKTLRKKLSTQEIRNIASYVDATENKLTPLCIGRGEAKIDGKLEQTYYVVVSAPALLKMRYAILKQFVERGGKADAFQAGYYYPHITLGFTKQDLHESSGVTKDLKSCVYALKKP